MKKNLDSTKIYLLIALVLIVSNSFAQTAVLNLKMFIQGYYCGYMGNICHNNTAAMQRVLYNECVDPNSNSTQCDTVTVSLLDSLGFIYSVTKGVLQTNGSLTVSFPSAVIGNRYYIYINHRNCIETSSANPVKFDTLTSYDFTTGATQAYGNNEVEVAAGAWAIYNGDINRDCAIDPFDFPPLDDTAHFRCVYANTDLNGDGIVDSLDLALFSLNVSSMPSCILPDGPFATGITTSLKIFIQGYYTGGGKMNPALYNQFVSSNPNEADSVQVSLVDSATKSIKQIAKGVLQNNGTLNLIFPTTMIGIGNKYYLKINHRNSIETWSKYTVLMSSGTSYDFTTGASQAFGNNLANLGGGIFGIYTGDINQDRSIDPFDFPPYDHDDNIQLMGVYKDAQGYSTDLNGDGSVDPFDFPVYNLNNSLQIVATAPF